MNVEQKRQQLLRIVLDKSDIGQQIFIKAHKQDFLDTLADIHQDTFKGDKHRTTTYGRKKRA